MKLQQLKNRIKFKEFINSKAVIYTVVVLFICLSSLYYFGLECEFPPNAEDIMPIFSMYSYLNWGTECMQLESLCKICIFLALKIGGVSYFSVRLFSTFMFFILLSGTVFLCLFSKTEHRAKLYLLPLVGLFSVVLFPASAHPELVWDTGGRDLIYLWPFYYHYLPRIYAVVCLILLCFLVRADKKRRKFFTVVLLVCVCLYAMKNTDLIFYITFLLPALIVMFLHIMRSDEWRKYAVIAVSGLMGVLLVSKVLPMDITRQLWTRETATVYGAVYGGTNWISPDLLGEHLLNYIKVIFLLFNIQLPESPVISLYTVVYILKIFFVIVGYILMMHAIKCSLTGKGNKYHYDCVDEILAWAYILLSLIYIFTGFGDIPFARYFPALTTIMTIFLCRNLEAFFKIIGLEMGREKKILRSLLFIYTSVLLVCSMEAVWKNQAPNEYDDDLKAMTEYIEGTQYGYAVAPYWIFPRATAISGGKVMVYQSKETVKEAHGEGAKVTYIITHSDNNPDNNGFTFYEHCNTYDELCEFYSEPTDIIRYNKLQLVVFKDGI